MRAPVSRRSRRGWPTPAPVIMDLLGMKQDGSLYLWQAAQKVQPMDRFPVTGDGRIVCGHYVLEMRGCAVTAHVSNGEHPGTLVVQVMCRGTVPVAMPLHAILSDVLGRVIPDPEEVAKTRALLRQLTEEAQARQTAPHRRRGHA